MRRIVRGGTDPTVTAEVIREVGARQIRFIFTATEDGGRILVPAESCGGIRCRSVEAKEREVAMLDKPFAPEEHIAKVRSLNRSLSEWTGQYYLGLSRESSATHRAEAAEGYGLRTWAIWGIISHGSDSVALAAALVGDKRKEARDDGLDILMWLSRDESVRELCEQFASDTIANGAEAETLDAALLALSRTASASSVAVLESLLARSDLDVDTMDLLFLAVQRSTRTRRRVRTREAAVRALASAVESRTQRAGTTSAAGKQTRGGERTGERRRKG